MFETFTLLLTEIHRTLFQKVKQSPILYFFFTSMMFFSVVMFAFLTLFLIRTEAEISLLDVFYGIFFIFFMKTAHDVHTYFITSPYLLYAFSTQISQTQTIRELFLTIFVINTGLWFLFSGLYLLILNGIGISISYPQEYLMFSIGVITAICLGATIAIHFFSTVRYRLLPTAILLIFSWISQSMMFLVITLPLAILHLWWSLSHAMDSYLFVKRKERTTDKSQVKIRNIIPTLYNREITVLWRDKLLYSFIATAILTGLFTGYLAIYGADLLLPDSLQDYAGEFLPDMFVFLGIYIVVLYTAVFPALNLFLNEEKTMWILHHLPLASTDIVQGKMISLTLCFLTTIPFLAYVSIFIGLDNILFLLWFLVFSYLAGVSIALPFGAKYVGKKSDILLLYSVAMILFAVLVIAGNAGLTLLMNIPFGSMYLGIILFIEIGILYSSMKLSSHILSIYET